MDQCVIELVTFCLRPSHKVRLKWMQTWIAYLLNDLKIMNRVFSSKMVISIGRFLNILIFFIGMSIIPVCGKEEYNE